MGKGITSKEVKWYEGHIKKDVTGDVNPAYLSRKGKMVIKLRTLLELRNGTPKEDVHFSCSKHPHTGWLLPNGQRYGLPPR